MFHDCFDNSTPNTLCICGLSQKVHTNKGGSINCKTMILDYKDVDGVSLITCININHPKLSSELNKFKTDFVAKQSPLTPTRV